MDDQVVFFFCVFNRYLFTISFNISFVSNLASTFSIKWCLIENKLKPFFSFYFNFSVLGNTYGCFRGVVTKKRFTSFIKKHCPIIRIHCRSLP